VSAAGYALGYLGGGLLLALNLAAIRRPDLLGLPDTQAAARLSFASVAVWWLLFSLPLFRRVPEPPHAAGDPAAGAWIGVAFRRLGRTFRDIRRYRHAFWFLLAFFVYNDGIQTIIRMAAIYGAEIGLRDDAMIAALLMTQFVGVPCALAFGLLARQTGPKAAVLGGLAVYVVVTLRAYGMRTEEQFFALAILVGMVQGGTQALSRSLFASMIPRHKSAEFFAFFGAVERYAGVLGPMLFGILVAQTGSSRQAILSVLAFFVVGGAMLAFVDVGAGRRAAREEEARAGG
jgi:UMF1 family MFS transporter